MQDQSVGKEGIEGLPARTDPGGDVWQNDQVLARVYSRNTLPIRNDKEKLNKREQPVISCSRKPMAALKNSID